LEARETSTGRNEKKENVDKAEEMCICSEGNRILGIYNRKWRNQNEPGKSKGDNRMANTEKRSRNTLICGRHVTIEKIYKGLCKDSSTINGFDERESEMEMTKRRTRIARKTEKGNNRRTGATTI
jgi:hypothetical protein